MNFDDKIPKSTYDELVNLMGKAGADSYLKRINYNYGAVTNKIIKLRFMKIAQQNPKLFYGIVIIISALVMFFILDFFAVF